ncbi:GNAT family N-acetyltransferase [Cognatishimia sp. MH4019]|uniref:GNAT family N-acetyltransferase n=1 Tax=Cognatishimia sp. MH4019 TaxID=2854030 RepID=UPI001CD66160|nr:GNAT family N-acetyltransferase [Cognatishimia sp. MH4019]
MQDFAILKTDRLLLRLPRESDAEAIAEALGDWEVTRWLGRAPWPYGLSDAEEFIDRNKNNVGLVWMIEMDGNVVGMCACKGELGYWVARKAWGQGIASEASRAVIDRYFAAPDVDVLPSGHAPENARSGRVLGKLGFRYTQDELRPSASHGKDVVIRAMELTRSDWMAQRALLLPHLETERLILRPMSADDAPRVAEIGGHPDVARMIFRATVPWPVDVVERFLHDWRWQGQLGFRLGVCRKDTGALIGTIGVGRPDYGHVKGQPDIFYFFDLAEGGQGFASEAVQAFVEAVFQRFEPTSLGADVFHDNPASMRVLTKVGFEKTGEGSATSAARLEPAPVSVYRLANPNLKATT